jgi:hypothetical protein
VGFVSGGPDKSPDEIRHDERGPGKCPRTCRYCKSDMARDQTRERADHLIAEGKLVRG